MKKIYVTVKNEKGEDIPSEDSISFLVYVIEFPQIGDKIIIDEMYEEESIYAEDDQAIWLYEFCKREFDCGKSSGFEFEVINRTIFRCYKESWVYIEVQYKPYNRNN